MYREKVLFQVDAGFGNQIITSAVYFKLVDLYGGPNVHVIFVRESKWDTESKVSFFRALTGYYRGEVLMIERGGKLDREYGRLYSCRNIGFLSTTQKRSIVAFVKINNEFNNDCSLFPVDQIDAIVDKYYPIDWNCITGAKPKKTYDIVLANGCMNTMLWFRRRYQRWNEVVKILTDIGYTVACVGNRDEYIPGCDDYTGQSIEANMELIANCKVCMGNNTGLTHFSNAVGTYTVVFISATNCTKDYNPERFDRYIRFVTSREPCAPCQGPWSLTDRWMACEYWKCSWSVDPAEMVHAVQMQIAKYIDRSMEKE
jgi:hypothetical protein